MDLPHERPPMWSTRKELEAALAQAGLGEWSPRLAAAARQTMILTPGPVEEGADARIGASRLGGMPDLPPDAPWPWRPAISGWTDDHTKPHAERPWPLSFGTAGLLSGDRQLHHCAVTPVVAHQAQGQATQGQGPIHSRTSTGTSGSYA